MLHAPEAELKFNTLTFLVYVSLPLKPVQTVLPPSSVLSYNVTAGCRKQTSFHPFLCSSNSSLLLQTVCSIIISHWCPHTLTNLPVPVLKPERVLGKSRS